jgi:salicylate hydroxylase
MVNLYLEDAFILSGLLAKVTPDSLSRALEAYQAVRVPAANTVLTGSYDSGMMYEFNGDDGVEYGKLGEAIQRQWKWIDETSVEEDLAIAVELANRK